MTLQELYDWAIKNKVDTNLPLYTNDEYCGRLTTNLESEIAKSKYEKGDDEGELSCCCGATRWHIASESDICSECKEHADFEEGLPERIYLSI